MRPPQANVLIPKNNADAPRTMAFSTFQPVLNTAPKSFYKKEAVVLPPEKYIGINTDHGLMTLRCREVNEYRINKNYRGNGVPFDKSTVGAHPPIGNKKSGIAWTSNRYGVLGIA